MLYYKITFLATVVKSASAIRTDCQDDSDGLVAVSMERYSDDYEYDYAEDVVVTYEDGDKIVQYYEDDGTQVLLRFEYKIIKKVKIWSKIIDLYFVRDSFSNFELRSRWYITIPKIHEAVLPWIFCLHKVNKSN